MGKKRGGTGGGFNPLAGFDQMESGKLPPQAKEIEQALLGCVIQHSDAYEAVAYLQPSDFYVHAHVLIWEAVQDLKNSGVVPELLALTQRLIDRGTLDIAGGAFYVAQLVGKIASSANVDHYGRIIKQQSMLRSIITLSSEASRSAYEPGTDVFELVDTVVQRIDKMMEVAQSRPSVTMGELADDQLSKIDDKHEVYSTGYQRLDKLLGGGWQPGDLWTVSARPGMGKTSFAMASARGAVRSGAGPCAFFQLELTERVTWSRMVAVDGQFNLSDVVARRLPPDELRRLHALHDSIRKLPIFFNFSTSATVEDIRREASRLIRTHGIKCLFIDQANWIKVPEELENGKEVFKHQHITRSLRKCAKELNIPIILMHQMNREITNRGGNYVPKLSDLKNSGSYEEDSQGVLFIHRLEYYGIAEDEHGPTHNRADLIVAKHSNGAVGTIHTRFVPESVGFVDDWSSPIPQPSPFAPHPDTRTTSLPPIDEIIDGAPF